jgi:drug/metabolite transporter (DMT)-like permease
VSRGDGRLTSGARERAEAYVALVSLSLIWSYTWILIKVASRDATPFVVAAARPAVGALALFAALALMRRPLRPTPLRDTMIFGLLQTGGWTGLQTYAVVLGGAGKTALLGYTMPFWVVLLAWPLLGERVTRLRWLALTLAAIGLAVILGPLGHGSFLPDALAIGAGLAWAAGTVWSKRMQREGEFDVLRLSAWQMVWGALPLVILAALFPERVDWTFSFVASMTFMSVISQGLGWVLWLFAVVRLPAGVAGIASLATPVLAVLFAALQLHEIPPTSEVVGMAFIVVALVVDALPSAKPSTVAQGAQR